jgi:addiction module HigA family antidote
LVREYLGDVSVSAAAAHLCVARPTLSRILNGHAGISADMAIRLSEALGTSAEFWLNLQQSYDLSIARAMGRPRIGRIGS